MSAHDPFSAGSAELSDRKKNDSSMTAAVGRSEDLLVECGDGDEETISYHLYLGTSLRHQATLLVVRFATRVVIVNGERLGSIRDEIASRRCARLRVSDRTEMMAAPRRGEPIVTLIRVLTPKTGEEVLAGELEGLPGLSTPDVAVADNG